MVAFYESLIRRLSHRLHRRRLFRERLGGVEDLHRAMRAKIQIVADDIFVTKPEDTHGGMSRGIANSVLIKLNQIGTVTETLDNHRDREAGGLYVRDLPQVGRDRGPVHRRPRRCDQRGPDQDGFRVGSERIAKYNQLMRIEEDSGMRPYSAEKAYFTA